MNEVAYVTFVGVHAVGFKLQEQNSCFLMGTTFL